ncbi:uncharacterized protein LOC124926579 [Impatiens glandulifera]|uniref:uncharacterized protein LOC124926579 n=1 Tax=Impatiens glandulifera TaxID=253017 RepID=UPI001FB075A8|nr:uncharacterized protein LOC124926579 [Impatiens glandulifera]
MSRPFLLKTFSLYSRTSRSPHVLFTLRASAISTSRSPCLLPSNFSSKFVGRFFSSENDASGEKTEPVAETVSTMEPTKQEEKEVSVPDVSNKELKMHLDKYFKLNDEEALPSILEAILKRKLAGKHEDTDDELLDELQMKPLDDVKEKEFESDFEELYDTDEEIDDLYEARNDVIKKMAKDEFFNMNDKKYDEMIKEAIEHGFLKDTKECETILEDMLSWDKLLPDDIKKKVEAKWNEIGDMVENGEVNDEEGYALFKEFEDKLILEYAQNMESEAVPEFDDNAAALLDKKKDLDDPPGEGPVLRWETRVVFAPGGDAWHPKNRKVKLRVTVKELGLSKYQFHRLRELAGKRYQPGKDELTITSERFEHREENRKDCLRTLFGLIEEAGKARKLVEDAQTSYMKDKLKGNPEFMARLRKASQPPVPASIPE